MSKKCTPLWREAHFQVKMYIKGPDNPTSQLLPKMSFNGLSGDREGRKDKDKGRKDKEGSVSVCEVIVFKCEVIVLCGCV